MILLRISYLAYVLLVFSGLPPVGAQTAPWTAPLRGAWVQRGAPAPGDVVLVGGASLCQIVVAGDEKSNVQQAAGFLSGDIQKISGRKPAVVKRASEAGVSIHFVTIGHPGIPAEINVASLRGQWESYRIATLGNTVWLVGSNPRGTAFAAYTLSERLGIDPLYIWTGYAPEHHDPLVLKRTAFTQGPPAFRYRGFFHDDEDILPRPFDANGYPLQTGDVPLEWYKRFFETALRLRMNMVAPYTRVHRRYEVQKLASDWGLYYTSHHYDILLSNPFGLERYNLAAERGVSPVYDWFTNREGMLTFWRGGVLENRDLDTIWPVGMRGTQDRPFVFPPGTTDDQKAATFREVIREQVKMATELAPRDKPPIFHFTMYSEMLPQYQRNPAAFDLPSNVIIVWPDDNDGHMRGLPKELGQWKHGVYYHLAYLGGNLTKQLTHTVAPSTVADEFSKIVKSGATEYMLVNMSETREYIMCGRMIADITWDAPAIFAQPNAAERYAAWWTREYFGTSAPAAEEAYQRYFTLLDTPDKLWIAPNAIEDILFRLYRKAKGESYPPMDVETVSRLQALKAPLEAAMAAEKRAGEKMPLAEKQFFTEDVALGLLVAKRQTDAALKLEEALRAPDTAHIWQPALEARASLEQLGMELLRQEYPPFERWYHETWIRSALGPSNPHRPYNQLRDFIGTQGRGQLATTRQF
jgi:hypothetical protein